MRIEHKTLDDFYFEARTKEMYSRLGGKGKVYDVEKNLVPFLKKIGKMLAQDMKIKGITKKLVVENSPLTYGTLTKILGGNEMMRIRDLYYLLRVLGLDIELHRDDDNCEVIFKGDRGLEY